MFVWCAAQFSINPSKINLNSQVKRHFYIFGKQSYTVSADALVKLPVGLNGWWITIIRDNRQQKDVWCGTVSLLQCCIVDLDKYIILTTKSHTIRYLYCSHDINDDCSTVRYVTIQSHQRFHATTLAFRTSWFWIEYNYIHAHCAHIAFACSVAFIDADEDGAQTLNGYIPDKKKLRALFTIPSGTALDGSSNIVVGYTIGGSFTRINFEPALYHCSESGESRFSVRREPICTQYASKHQRIETRNIHGIYAWKIYFCF